MQNLRNQQRTAEHQTKASLSVRWLADVLAADGKRPRVQSGVAESAEDHATDLIIWRAAVSGLRASGLSSPTIAETGATAGTAAGSPAGAPAAHKSGNRRRLRAGRVRQPHRIESAAEALISAHLVLRCLRGSLREAAG